MLYTDRSIIYPEEIRMQLYIAENIKTCRKRMGLTQKEVADILCVSPQSISKWERGETCPDITLLPALANLFKTSIDALIGMDKINDSEAGSAVFKSAHERLRSGDHLGAAEVLVRIEKEMTQTEINNYLRFPT